MIQTDDTVSIYCWSLRFCCIFFTSLWIWFGHSYTQCCCVDATTFWMLIMKHCCSSWFALNLLNALVDDCFRVWCVAFHHLYIVGGVVVGHSRCVVPWINRRIQQPNRLLEVGNNKHGPILNSMYWTWVARLLPYEFYMDSLPLNTVCLPSHHNIRKLASVWTC